MKTVRNTVSRAAATPQDLPAMLREQLRAAMRRNPRFSLRSFARQLGIDHSTLSQVLRNKRRLSAGALEAIGKRLGLGEEAIRTHREKSGGKANHKRPPADPRSFSFDLDTFQLLTVWHHSAILELVQVQAFRADSRWISKALGITVEDVNIALQRLLRLGLLEMPARDRWVDKSGDAEFDSAALTETVCDQVNLQVHELAIQAVQHVPAQHRIHGQMAVALDSRRLPRLRMLVAEFMEQLRALASESPAKDDVYQLDVSLFPLTTFQRTKGEKHG